MEDRPGNMCGMRLGSRRKGYRSGVFGMSRMLLCLRRSAWLRWWRICRIVRGVVMPRTTLLHVGVEVEGIHCWLDLVHVTIASGKAQWLTILDSPDIVTTLEIAHSEEQGISHHTAYVNGAVMVCGELAVKPLGGRSK